MTDLRDQLQATLGSAYALERELTGGGMSRVFVAVETALGRQVVVKVLPSEMAGQVSFERFKREIAVAAQLQHPHIVPLLTAGETDGLPYFTMPFVKGESLRRRLSKEGELPISEAVRILREVASALAFAHDAGVVHRDIKPDNILLSAGAAMVTDFGVAKALSASSGGGGAITSLGIALGTPAYMAPEQAAADPLVDHRADIYAWGILAYELLTGAIPFSGRPPAAMLAAHATETPEPVTRRRGAIPPALGALVMRCLEKRAADRPQRAEELMQALDAITTPSGGLQPTGTTPAAATRKTRWRTIVGIGAAIVVVAAASLAYVVSTRGQSRPNAPRSIAVLPFSNASRDTAIDYLTDGIGDEIHSQLTKVSGLSVRGRTSWNSLRGDTIDPKVAGARLGVDALVIGRVTGSNGRLRVAVDLIRVSDGTAMWSETYEHDVRDLSAIRDSITNGVRVALGLTGGARGRADNPEARQLYLRGRYAASKTSEADLREGLRLFGLALQKDSEMVDAYAGIAWVHLFLADAYVSPAVAYPRMRDAALHALRLDSASADGHFLLGETYSLYDWNFDAAEREYLKAISLNSQLADAHSALGIARCFAGRIDAGIAAADGAVAIDPRSAMVRFLRGICLEMGHRYREAIEAQQRVLELDPTFFYSYSHDAMGYRSLGILDSALVASERDVKLADGAPQIDLALTYARLGRIDDAKQVIRSLESRFQTSYYPAEGIAMAYASIGDLDSAFTWLDRVFETRSALWHEYRTFPEWERIARDPRWDEFLRRASAARR